MSYASTNLIRPTAAHVPCFIRFRNPNRFFSFKSGLIPRIVSGKFMYRNSRTRNYKDTSDCVGDKDSVLDTEALLHGSSSSSLSSSSSQVVGFSGFEAALNNLSKWLVAVLFGSVLLWRRDAESLWAASGSVINSALSTVLKRMLNQKRPYSTLRSDPGMPSSHAQSIFYTTTFYVVSMVQCFGLNGLTAAVSGLIFALGSYFSWLRISQKLHTMSQVLVGAALGFCFSALWFWLWDAIVLKAFISSLLVRIIVVLGAAGFCVAFVIYVIRYWVIDEQ